MSNLPIWFLDIDGVVNVLPKRNNPPKFKVQEGTVTYFDNDYGKDNTLQIMWRPDVVDFINQVHRDRLAEIHWLTTWGELARTHFAPLVGLDDFSFTYEPAPSGSRARIVWYPEWWKLNVINKVGIGGRFIFTDDDLSKETRKMIRNHLDDKGDALLITPYAERGLDDEHLQRISEFLQASAA